jgi:hypothetical protein
LGPISGIRDQTTGYGLPTSSDSAVTGLLVPVRSYWVKARSIFAKFRTNCPG